MDDYRYFMRYVWHNKSPLDLFNCLLFYWLDDGGKVAKELLVQVSKLLLMMPKTRADVDVSVIVIVYMLVYMSSRKYFTLQTAQGPKKNIKLLKQKKKINNKKTKVLPGLILITNQWLWAMTVGEIVLQRVLWCFMSFNVVWGGRRHRTLTTGKNIRRCEKPYINIL